MGELTRSVLQRIANKLRGVSIEPINPTNRDEFARAVYQATKDKSTQKRPSQHGILGAAFDEATDEFGYAPGKGGYLALDEDKNVVGGVAFHPRVHAEALNDPALSRYLEELNAWPGEIQYLASSRPGVGTALFQAARANMMDQRDDIDTLLMSLRDAVPFYRKKGMIPIDERMRDVLEPGLTSQHLLWWKPMSHMDHSLPPWEDVAGGFAEGGAPLPERASDSTRARNARRTTPTRSRQSPPNYSWAGVRG